MQYKIESTSINKVTLNNEKDIAIITAHDISINKRYLLNFIIVIENQCLTANFADSMILKEEFRQFDKGDIQNKYCKIVERSIKNKMTKSLKVSINKKDYFFCRSESIAIYKLLNSTIHGFNYHNYCDFDIIKEMHNLDQTRNGKYRNAEIVSIET